MFEGCSGNGWALGINCAQETKEKTMRFVKRISIIAIALLAAWSFPLHLAAQQPHFPHHKYRLVNLGTFGGLNSLFNAGPVATCCAQKMLCGPVTSTPTSLGGK
jgi:hypothetical protein